MDDSEANSKIVKTIRNVFLVFACGLVCSSVFIKGEKTKMNRAQLVRELIADEGYVNEIYKDHLGCSFHSLDGSSPHSKTSIAV